MKYKRRINESPANVHQSILSTREVRTCRPSGKSLNSRRENLITVYCVKAARRPRKGDSFAQKKKVY